MAPGLARIRTPRRPQLSLAIWTYLSYNQDHLRTWSAWGSCTTRPHLAVAHSDRRADHVDILPALRATRAPRSFEHIQPAQFARCEARNVRTCLPSRTLYILKRAHTSRSAWLTVPRQRRQLAKEPRSLSEAVSYPLSAKVPVCKVSK